jgi:uncharacterized protein YjgD (DUF1641 family)
MRNLTGDDQMATKSTKSGSARSVELLKSALGSAAVKPSGVVDHKLDSKGLELTLFISKDKLTRESTRDLLTLLMSDMM